MPIWMLWDGIAAIPKKGRIRLPGSFPMFGVCMTCTAMSGNGVRTGMGIILRALLPIQLVHLAVRTGCDAAAAGSVAPGTAGLLIGSAARPAAGAALWASAF